jgi:hypothetical protein
VPLPPPARAFSAARGLSAPTDMSSESGSFLFSALGDVSRPWSKSAAGSALTVAVTAALGPGVRATLHSARQSFLTRAAIAGLSQTASSTWGGWEGHDVLHYARQDLDAMLVVGRQLAGMSLDEPDIILPYGARWTATGALPPAHSFERVLCAARRTIAAFAATPGRPVFSPSAPVADKLALISSWFPLFEPDVVLVPLVYAPSLPLTPVSGPVSGASLVAASGSLIASASRCAAFISGSIFRLVTGPCGSLMRFSRVDMDSARWLAAPVGKPELPHVCDVLARAPAGWANVFNAWHGSFAGVPAIRLFRACGVYNWVRMYRVC